MALDRRAERLLEGFARRKGAVLDGRGWYAAAAREVEAQRVRAVADDDRDREARFHERAHVAPPPGYEDGEQA